VRVTITACANLSQRDGRAHRYAGET
jgi:hypothetical protein